MLRIQNNVKLAPQTWFRVGGNAKNFIKLNSVDEIKELLIKFPDFFIIGNTSNLLISDNDIEQCIIKLGSVFAKVEQISETSFKVGSACLDSTLSQIMQEKGISGMEFLSTIPGTIGGNVIMNAGCFGCEIFEILDSIEIMLCNGEIMNLKKSDISYEYRKAYLPEKSIILSAIISGVVSKPENIKKVMHNYIQKRLEAQPSNVRTGGSTFKNTKNKSTWELIRECGADKFFTLGENIRKAVFEKTGIELEWEIKKLGIF